MPLYQRPIIKSQINKHTVFLCKTSKITNWAASSKQCMSIICGIHWMLSVLVVFAQLWSLLAAGRPAEKDRPFLVNLRRNFFLHCQKHSDMIRERERKWQKRPEQKKEEKLRQRWSEWLEKKMDRNQWEWHRHRVSSRKDKTPPWFQ